MLKQAENIKSCGKLWEKMLEAVKYRKTFRLCDRSGDDIVCDNDLVLNGSEVRKQVLT